VKDRDPHSPLAFLVCCLVLGLRLLLESEFFFFSFVSLFFLFGGTSVGVPDENMLLM
jgi:hypothetical protein